MLDSQKPYFNEICTQMQAQGLLEAFQHRLHALVFPGKTHLPQYNLIWALECSTPAQWTQAIDETVTASYEAMDAAAPQATTPAPTRREVGE